MSDFKSGSIDGVLVRPVKKHRDDRGWLAETYRRDEIPARYLPQMSYISVSLPGTIRGPHEHADQSDYFVFLGPGNVKVWLWDNRKDSATYWNRMVFLAGIDNPTSVLIPEGVVHAYQNLGSENVTVLNFPNRLFMGEGHREPVDEIRHEADPKTPFHVE